MTPAAQVFSASQILQEILNGKRVDSLLKQWGRSNRYAGSKDRHAIRDFVYNGLRNKRSALSKIKAPQSGRNWAIGVLIEANKDLNKYFNDEAYASSCLTVEEKQAIQKATEYTKPPDVELNIPAFLWPIWNADLRAEAENIAKNLCERAPAFLRVNLQRISIPKVQDILLEDNIHTEQHPFIATALIITNGQNKIKNCIAFKEGLVEIQDASSQASVIDLPRNSNLKILDYCCGSGGKSLALHAWTNGKIFAYDALPERTLDLQNRAEKAGAKITEISKPIKDSFDVIFCDVPCSGSGSWRRDPAGKWNLTATSWKNLLNKQIEILDEAKQLLSQNGTLVYATCSVLLTENYKQVKKFCSSNPDFEIVKAHQFYPSDLGDGFFYGFLKKI